MRGRGAGAAPVRRYMLGALKDIGHGFEYAWQTPDPEPDEGPGLTWGQLTPRHWSGTWETKIRGTVTRMACTGDAPLSGTAKIPGQVVTHFGVNDTQLRIVQTNGVALTGTVRLSCVIEVDLTPEGAATMDRLRAAAGAG